MAFSTHVRWLALHACRPYLRNTFVDTGKAFLLSRLAGLTDANAAWGFYGIRPSALRTGSTIDCRMTCPRERALYFAGEEPSAGARLLERVLDRRFRFVDIGARAGIATLVAAAQVDEVISVEPHPIERAMLERNLALNDVENVRVLPYAFGSRRDVLRIADARAHQTSSSAAREEPSGFDVDVLTGDSIVAPSSTFRTWVRIDAPGSELSIAKGLDRLLDSDEVVFHLAIDRAARRNGPSDLEIVAWFRVRGYYPYAITAPALRAMRPTLRRLREPPRSPRYEVLFTRHQTAHGFWTWTRQQTVDARRVPASRISTREAA